MWPIRNKLVDGTPFEPGGIIVDCLPAGHKIESFNYSEARAREYKTCSYCNSPNQKETHCRSCSAPLPGFNAYNTCKNGERNIDQSKELQAALADASMGFYKPQRPQPERSIE